MCGTLHHLHLCLSTYFLTSRAELLKHFVYFTSVASLCYPLRLNDWEIDLNKVSKHISAEQPLIAFMTVSTLINPFLYTDCIQLNGIRCLFVVEKRATCIPLLVPATASERKRCPLFLLNLVCSLDCCSLISLEISTKSWAPCKENKQLGWLSLFLWRRTVFDSSHLLGMMFLSSADWT